MLGGCCRWLLTSCQQLPVNLTEVSALHHSFSSLLPLYRIHHQTGLPADAAIDEVVEFFELRFGTVVEVQLCQDDYELVSLFKKRTATVQQLKRLNAK